MQPKNSVFQYLSLTDIYRQLLLQDLNVSITVSQGRLCLITLNLKMVTPSCKITIADD